jgi:putative aldouronate transport system permease protein
MANKHLPNRNLHPTIMRYGQTVLYLIVKSADAIEASGTTRGLVVESFKMAAAAITVLPILLVYPFMQKHFVKGALLGSIKG